MGLATSAVIDAVILEGGFDSTQTSTSRATVLGWVNDRFQRAVVDAKWLKAQVELGPTVSGTSTYAIPPAVQDIAALKVNASRSWKRVTPEEMWSLQSVDARLRGAEGAFAPAYSAAGAPLVELYPTPSVSGQSISALVAQTPAALTDGAGIASLPDHLFRAIMVDGPIAEGRKVVDERDDLAAGYEAKYTEAVGKLKLLTKSRVGSGAWQAKVAGVS